MSRLRIRVYDADPGTLPRIGGVLEARARARIELHGPPPDAAPEGAGRGADAARWLESLAEGEVDLALCPIEAAREILDDRITILGVPERGDPRDVLLGRFGDPVSLAQLPAGSAVITYTRRTTGLVRANRPDVETLEGSELAADLARIDGGAAAGLITSYNRVAGTSDLRRIGEAFPVTAWIPEPGQGALVILTRTGKRTPGRWRSTWSTPIP